jgi:hypothetical protein
MPNQLQVSHKAELTTLKPAVAARLNQFVASWRPVDVVPEGAVPFLAPAIVIAEAELAPVGPMGVAVLLDPLWAIFPMPSDDALDVWHKTLEPYPADLIESAVRHLIATRTWDKTPPVPGQIVANLKAEHQARNNKLNRLRLIAAKAPKAKAKAEATRESPEARAAFVEKLREKYPEGVALVGCAGKSMPGTVKERDGRTSEWDGLSDNDIPRLREQALRGLEVGP